MYSSKNDCNSIKGYAHIKMYKICKPYSCQEISFYARSYLHYAIWVLLKKKLLSLQIRVLSLIVSFGLVIRLLMILITKMDNIFPSMLCVKEL